MSTPTPDWESLRQSVRGYVGAKVNTADHADEITQQTMLRLLERTARGEEFRSLEGASITEAGYAAHSYWQAVTEDRRNARDAKAALTISRGKRRGPTSTKLVDRVGDEVSVRLPNVPRGVGRPRKDSPRRRMPVVVLLPDGSQLVLKTRRSQEAYKSVTMHGTPSSLLFVLAFCGDVPPAPWEVSRELRLIGESLDRDRWRDAEQAIRTPRRKR